MIATALRAEIERLSQDLCAGNPLYQRAADGSLGPDHLARYLANVHLLVQHTPVHLERARRAALERGDEALAAHFSHKLGEEVGHDAWAERDLGRVSSLAGRAKSPEILPSMRALVASIGELLERDPRLYLAYVLVAEYVVVLLGPAWLDLLEARCGIPRSAMTVIASHAELDRDHTEEAFDRLDELVGDPRLLAPMREVVRRSMALLDAFLRDVVSATDAELAARRRHVPAA